MPYSFSDLQFVYQLLNHEWNLLIYGERDASWGERFLTWLRQFETYVWEFMGYKTPENRGYCVLGLVVVMGLGIIFAVYKLIGNISPLGITIDHWHKEIVISKSNASTSTMSYDQTDEKIVRSKDNTATAFLTQTAIVKPTVRIASERTKAIDATESVSTISPFPSAATQRELKVASIDSIQSSNTTLLTTSTVSRSISLKDTLSSSNLNDDTLRKSHSSHLKVDNAPESVQSQTIPTLLTESSSSLCVLTSRNSVNDGSKFDERSQSSRGSEANDLAEACRQLVEAVSLADLAPTIAMLERVVLSEEGDETTSNSDTEGLPSTVHDTTAYCSPRRDKNSVSIREPDPAVSQNAAAGLIETETCLFEVPILTCSQLCPGTASKSPALRVSDNS